MYDLNSLKGMFSPNSVDPLFFQNGENSNRQPESGKKTVQEVSKGNSVTQRKRKAKTGLQLSKRKCAQLSKRKCAQLSKRKCAQLSKRKCAQLQAINKPSELLPKLEMSTYTKKINNNADSGQTTITNLRNLLTGKILLSGPWSEASIEIFNSLNQRKFDYTDPKKSTVVYKQSHVKIQIAQALIENSDKLAVIKKRYSSKRLEKHFFEACKKEAKIQMLAEKVAPKVYGIAQRLDCEKHLKFYLAMEFNGEVDFYTYLKYFDPKTKVYIALEAAKKLLQLHQLGIYHGDIKLMNLVVDQKLGVKFIDFDCAEIMRDGNPIKIHFVPDTIRLYHAPEIYVAAINGMDKDIVDPENLQALEEMYCLKGNELKLPKKADIYSFGAVMAALLNDNEKALLFEEKYDTVCSDKSSKEIMNSAVIDENMKQLIERMLSYDPTERPELEDVITALDVHYQQLLTQ